MAIQVRRGNEVDFDPSKMLPGEWAVSLDTKYVRMCFSPGVCLRMATYEAFEADMEQIKALLAEAESIEEAVANIQTEINDIAVVVEDYAIISKSYAVGGTGKRENEDSDNAKYYYEQTKQISQGINGIVPMGTVTFANLPTSDIVKNAMYNVSDAFVSDERFNDGGGVSYGPGNNVIWTAEGFWDVTASSSVTGVKGENETTYRQGNVNITKESIGVGDYGTENISDIADGTVKGAIRELADNPADASVWLSKDEYDALSEEQQNNGTEYQIYDSKIVMKNGVLIGGDFSTADRVKYSDTQNVKEKIDEVNSNLNNNYKTLWSDSSLSEMSNNVTVTLSESTDNYKGIMILFRLDTAGNRLVSPVFLTDSLVAGVALAPIPNGNGVYQRNVNLISNTQVTFSYATNTDKLIPCAILGIK